MRWLLIAAAVAACQRAQPAAPANDKASPPESAAADELAFLPSDYDIVAGIDFGTVTRTQLWQQLAPQANALLRKLEAELGASCAQHDYADLGRSAVALGRLGSDFTGVLVIRGSGAARLFDCMVAEVTQAAGADAVVDDGGVTIMSNRGVSDMKNAAKLLGDSTLVVHRDPAASHDTLMRVLAAGAPLRKVPAFMTMFERREPGAAMWVIANGDEPVFDELAMAGRRPVSADGTLVVGTTLTVAMRMTMRSPSDASVAADDLTNVQPLAARHVTRFDIAAQGAITNLRVELTAAQTRAVIPCSARYSRSAAPPRDVGCLHASGAGRRRGCWLSSCCATRAARQQGAGA